MQFTIPRRWYSTLPQITVEIDAKYERSTNAVRLGAAVKVFVGQARAVETDADLTRAVLTDAVLTGADLTRAVLTDAVLTGADLTRAVLTGAVLTGADLTRAVLTGAVLTDADLTGAVLTRAVLTGAVLTGAVLTDAVLTGAVLTRAVLTDAVLTGADLTRAVLTGAVLTGAVLTDAVLTGAVLTGADLTRAVLTDADLTDAVPEVPNIDAAIYAAITDGSGHLEMDAWHKCETTHCRAGWAITLAGEAGQALEKRYGPAAAGALIYAKSRPGIPLPNFYASDEDALADIKAHAGVE